MSEHTLHPTNGRIVAKEDLDAPRVPMFRSSDGDSDRKSYRATMEEIRTLYRALAVTHSDDGAFEALVAEQGVYAPRTFPLAKVTDALVRISRKAQRMNAKYYGGRYR